MEIFCYIFWKLNLFFKCTTFLESAKQYLIRVLITPRGQSSSLVSHRLLVLGDCSLTPGGDEDFPLLVSACNITIAFYLRKDCSVRLPPKNKLYICNAQIENFNTFSQKAWAWAVWGTKGIVGLFFNFTYMTMKGPNKRLNRKKIMIRQRDTFMN